MELKRWIVLGAAVLPLVAVAEEVQVESPFAGVYAGLYGGHAHADDDGTGYFQDGSERSGYTQSVSPAGGVYGLKLGYNWIFANHLMLGLEADYEGRSKNEDKGFQDYEGVSTEPAYGVETQLNQAGYLLARAGYQFNDKGLVYVNGGYATVQAKRSYTDNFSDTKESHHSWQDGWAAGVGLEYMLTEKLSAIVEYRYADYGSKDVDADLWGEYYKQDLKKEESLLVGAAWHF